MRAIGDVMTRSPREIDVRERLVDEAQWLRCAGVKAKALRAVLHALRAA